MSAFWTAPEVYKCLLVELGSFEADERAGRHWLVARVEAG
jgi:hypothetical protein